MCVLGEDKSEGRGVRGRRRNCRVLPPGRTQHAVLGLLPSPAFPRLHLAPSPCTSKKEGIYLPFSMGSFCCIDTFRTRRVCVCVCVFARMGRCGWSEGGWVGVYHIASLRRPEVVCCCPLSTVNPLPPTRAEKEGGKNTRNCSVHSDQVRPLWMIGKKANTGERERERERERRRRMALGEREKAGAVSGNGVCFYSWSRRQSRRPYGERESEREGGGEGGEGVRLAGRR